jgi:uncharacterized membrane protein
VLEPAFRPATFFYDENVISLLSKRAEMKWLKYLLAAIGGVMAILLIVLLFLGGGRGLARHVHSIDIDKPADTVFGWVSRPEKLKSWVGWLVDIRDLTPDRIGVGAKQVWVMEDRNNGHKRIDIDCEVTGYEPGRMLESRLHAPEEFTGDVRYELEPMAASRTRLTYRGSFKYEHWLAKLLEPVISRSAQHKLEDDMARLKQQIEAE